MNALTTLTLCAALVGAAHATFSGQPTEADAALATAASVQDAQAQAADLRDALRLHQAQHPELWTPETRQRADAAVGVVVAGGVRPIEHTEARQP